MAKQYGIICVKCMLQWCLASKAPRSVLNKTVTLKEVLAVISEDDSPHFWGRLPISEDDPPFLRTTPHFWGRLPISEDDSPFLRTTPHFWRFPISVDDSPFLRTTLPISEDDSPFLRTTPHFWGRLPISEDDSPHKAGCGSSDWKTTLGILIIFI
jgi:hypothetical protein